MERAFEKFLTDCVKFLLVQLKTPLEDCRIRHEYGWIPFDSLNACLFCPSDNVLKVLKVFAMQCHLQRNAGAGIESPFTAFDKLLYIFTPKVTKESAHFVGKSADLDVAACLNQFEHEGRRTPFTRECPVGGEVHFDAGHFAKVQQVLES